MALKPFMILLHVLAVPIWGVRHLQCFLLFTGVTLAYTMRVNLSIAIVAMTDKNSTGQDFAEYIWTEKQKSLLLSSFFWGYITTQVLSGHFARKFGGKIVLLVGLIISSVLAILTPLSVSMGGWKLFFAIRVIQGMSQGVVLPSVHTLLAKWAPEEERTLMGNYCYSGSQFGCALMLAGSGFIASSFLGWPSIFYISGGFGVAWTAAWFIWGASAPSEYTRISLAEKNLIETSLSKGTETSNHKHSLKTPWLKFATSKPLWALLVAQCAYTYCSWTLLTETPTYMKNILGFNIRSNAIWTALPYFIMLLLSFVFSGSAAALERRKCVTRTQSRKIFNTIGLWLPAAALVCLSFIDTTLTHWAVLLINVAVGLSAAIHVGFLINHIDLSPNFAGILLGITNMVANVMSILAPLVVGFIVTDEKNSLQWRNVFFIVAGFSFIGNLLFILFGSAKVQQWNEPNSANNNEMQSFKTIDE